MLKKIVVMISVLFLYSCDKSPVDIDDNTEFLTEIVKIAAGGKHNLALKNDGTVWAWGWNEGGQLGNNAAKNSNVPVQVQLN